jgi:hypothetical protein
MEKTSSIVKKANDAGKFSTKWKTCHILDSTGVRFEMGRFFALLADSCRGQETAAAA